MPCRECGDLRWVYVLRNHNTLKTASGQPINEAKVFARGLEFMARDADPAKALNAAFGVRAFKRGLRLGAVTVRSKTSQTELAALVDVLDA